MNDRMDAHLTYDRQLLALVDPKDMDAREQAHLQSCPRCRKEAEKLNRRFERLGQTARKLAPEPSRPYRLPAKGVRRGAGWQFKSALAMGVAGALVLVFTVFVPQRFHPTQPGPQQLARQATEDAQLMARVDELVKDALPKAYQELARLDDSRPMGLSKDLIDWIVPIIEEDEPLTDPRA